MNTGAEKRIGSFVLPKVGEAKVVARPRGTGKGYWVGGPSAIYDAESNCFYLFWRERVPGERGIKAVIARSEDGESFGPVWSVEKSELEAISIERAALVRVESGLYRLYISYEDTADNRWKIDVMEASKPEGFRPASRQRVIEPEQLGVRWTKDPYVLKVGCLWHMYVHVRELNGRKNTSLAVSDDGITFRWLGKIIEGRGWDDYCVRLTTVLYRPPVFFAFYDGATVEEENCEERTGLAQSFDLRNFERVSENAPVLKSPEGSTSLRYVEAVQLPGRARYWFEYCRADGSHDLRTLELPVE